jgi:hypothetical protein
MAGYGVILPNGRDIHLGHFHFLGDKNLLYVRSPINGYGLLMLFYRIKYFYNKPIYIAKKHIAH